MSDPGRDGLDPRPTPQELSEWTARAACGEAIEPGDVLRLLQEVRRLRVECDGWLDEYFIAIKSRDEALKAAETARRRSEGAKSGWEIRRRKAFLAAAAPSAAPGTALAGAPGGSDE